MPQNKAITVRKPTKKCRICGKKVFSSQSIYCRTCSDFEHRMDVKRFSPEAKKAIRNYVRKYYYTCHFTGMPLDMKDDTGPWYCTFNHLIPGDPRKIVLTSSLLNEMKEDKTIKELWYYVLQLDDHRKKHTKFRKKNPIHWHRLNPPNVKECAGCGRSILIKRNRYCDTCTRIAQRMRFKFFSHMAKKAIWAYIRKYGYVCYYTGMALDLDDEKSPWYLVFDHWKPRDSRRLVLTSRLVNEMKEDMTEKEFWYMISQLANHIRKGTRVRKIKLRYWSRPYSS